MGYADVKLQLDEAQKQERVILQRAGNGIAVTRVSITLK